MNTDKAKGKANEIAGRAQRQLGKITGSKKTQLKGAARQAGGELQQVKGKVKDAVKKVSRNVRASMDSEPKPRVTTRTKTTRTTVTTRTRPG